MQSRPVSSSRRAALLRLSVLGVLILALFVGYRLLAPKGPPPLIVYCAHDSLYSEGILREFGKRTGIPVEVRFDTEATKSLGLVELIMREKDRPRCDVFWNNQVLGTVDLREQGLLLPYKGPGYDRIPAQFKDPDGDWAGFAARWRVYIVNTDKLAPTPEAVEKAVSGDLSRVAIPKPLYGTTFAQYAVFWDIWGEEKLKAWHHDWRRRGVREVGGCAQVKNLVAEGVCDLGLVDSDDYFVAKDEGKPVGMVPVTLGKGESFCIPNTVCIIKGTQHLAAAQKLVDYLLSEECETALANSQSRQFPLGPVDKEKLPPEVREFMSGGPPPFSIGWMRKSPRACMAWLKSEYTE